MTTMSEVASENCGHRGQWGTRSRRSSPDCSAKAMTSSASARHRPESWPSAADFVVGDIRDAATVRRAVDGRGRRRRTAPGRPIARSTSRAPRNVLDAMAETGTRRIVFASSAHVDGGTDKHRRHRRQDPRRQTAGQARVEQMLARLGAMGRDPLRADHRPQRRQLGAPSAGLTGLARAGPPIVLYRSSTPRMRNGCSCTRYLTPESTAAQSISPRRAS